MEVSVPSKQVAMERAWSRTGDIGRRPIMLGIAGDSAAGKTTLTGGLVKALGEDRVTSICSDDYHRYDREERKTLPFTPLHPDCNYIEIMEQHLQLLALGQPVLKPRYDHENGALLRPVLVEPREFIIVEGLHPLYSKLSRACFDITVFLDPPESIRRDWKVARDTTKRGYTEEQVIADLEKREPESEAYIRSQRQHADIVVRFSPIEERGESNEDPLSATLLLRPTIQHPDMSQSLADIPREVMHMKLVRDQDNRPVDALHLHAYASEGVAEKVEKSLLEQLGLPDAGPDVLGKVEGREHSAPLALAQLILVFHLLQAAGDLENQSATAATL